MNMKHLRLAAISVMLALAGCAAYPAQPTGMAGYYGWSGYDPGPYTDYGFYDGVGVYPLYAYGFHGHDFHHFAGHPGFEHGGVARHGFDGGFDHVGMNSHFGGGHFAGAHFAGGHFGGGGHRG